MTPNNTKLVERLTWRPIETAPNGELILVCGQHGGVEWWMNVSWRDDGEDADLASGPTHWMPLPEPPGEDA